MTPEPLATWAQRHHVTPYVAACLCGDVNGWAPSHNPRVLMARLIAALRAEGTELGEGQAVWLLAAYTLRVTAMEVVT